MIPEVLCLDISIAKTRNNSEILTEMGAEAESNIALHTSSHGISLSNMKKCDSLSTFGLHAAVPVLLL